MQLLCETNLDEPHHDFGEIMYCTKCCWKRINLKSNETAPSQMHNMNILCFLNKIIQ